MAELLPFKAWDNNTYSRTVEYPNDFSLVSDSGIRHFADHPNALSTMDPRGGIFRLLPRSQLLSMVTNKSSVGSTVVNLTAGKLIVSHASFQAYKDENEDRSFVHEFPGGLFFGVLDGLYSVQFS